MKKTLSLIAALLFSLNAEAELITSTSGGGGGAPSGGAGGDLSGTYPNPTVAKVDAVSYPASPSTNTVPVVTGANAVTYETAPIAAGGTNATTAGGALDSLTSATATYSQSLSRLGTGSWVTQPSVNVLGSCSYYDYTVTNSVTPGSDQITPLQDWLDECQLQAFTLMTKSGSTSPISLDDQNERNCIRAILPRGNYQVSSPLIIPEDICADFQGTIIRLGASGAVTNTYTGDTTTQALANKEQPAVIVVPRAHLLNTLTVYGNSNGSDNGSGVILGKYWYVAGSGSATVQAVGANYQVGDVLTFPMPSKPLYSAAQFTVSSINGGGGITGGTITFQGMYPLPSIQQQYQWTAANGFTGSIAAGTIGQVFDPAHTGWYITSGGHGTGAEFTLAWATDFLTSPNTYNCGAIGGLGADTYVANINAQGIGIINDVTYGPTFGTMWCGLNFDISGQVESNGGWYGDYLYEVADVHGGTFNPVNSEYGIKIVKGASMNFSAVVDTPVKDCVDIDGTQGVSMRGYAINKGSNAFTGNGCVVVGADTNYSSAGSLATGVSVDMTLYGVGDNIGTLPASYLDYLTGTNYFNLDVVNTSSSGSAITNPAFLFSQFGTHNVGNVGSIHGEIDQVAGKNIFSGTVPQGDVHIFDSSVGAWVGSQGLYNYSQAGAPVNGTTGLSKAPAGSTYYNTTSGQTYQNTGTSNYPVWTQDTYPGYTAIKSVQPYTITIASGNTTNTATLNTAITTANAFILPAGCSSSQATATNYDSTIGYAAITNATTITLTRAVSNTDSLTCTGTVVEMNPGYVNSVTAGTIAISGAQSSNTATISAVGSNAFAIFEGATSTTQSGAHPSYVATKVALTNSTTVTASVGLATETLTVAYEVVDLPSSVIASIQQLAHTDATSATSYTDTINQVVPGNTVLVNDGVTIATGTTYQEYAHTLQLTNGTTVTLTRGNGANTTTRTQDYTAVQFQPGILNGSVQRGTIALASAASGTATPSPAIPTNIGLVNLSGYLNPNNAAQNVILPTLNLTNGATVTTALNTSGSTTVSWEAIPFNNIAAIQPTPGGRLTLSSSAPVMNANATAQSAVWYLPYSNGNLPMFNGTQWVNYSLPPVLSLALDSNSGHTGYQQSGKEFDLFGFLNSGTLQVCSGPAWTNSTTRANAIQQLNGLWVNTAAITLKCDATSTTYSCAADQCSYLGSMYATANGQTGVNIKPAAASGGGANIIGLWNAYNRVALKAMSMDSGAAYTYASNTWQKADNSVNNSVSWIDGLGQTAVTCKLGVAAGTATTGDAVNTGCNLNSQSATPDVWGYGESGVATLADNYQTITVEESFLPTQGFNYVQAMEKSPAAVTATFNPGGNTQRLVVDTEY